jgi:IS5 family transposase
MKRRAAVEPVIGHIKAEHWMDRNYLKGREGDRINAVLAAAGYNFSLLLRWLRLLCQILRLPSSSRSSFPPEIRILHGRLGTWKHDQGLVFCRDTRVSMASVSERDRQFADIAYCLLPRPITIYNRRSWTSASLRDNLSR